MLPFEAPDDLDPRTRSPFLTLPVVMALMGLGVVLAFIVGRVCAGYGIAPIGIWFFSVFGFACITPIAWILFKLDQQEVARARAANERIGWSAVEAENERRIMEMRLRKARAASATQGRGE